MHEVIQHRAVDEGTRCLFHPADNQLLNLPSSKFTVREREMLIGSGILPPEFFVAAKNPFVIGFGVCECCMATSTCFLHMHAQLCTVLDDPRCDNESACMSVQLYLRCAMGGTGSAARMCVIPTRYLPMLPAAQSRRAEPPSLPTHTHTTTCTQCSACAGLCWRG